MSRSKFKKQRNALIEKGKGMIGTILGTNTPAVIDAVELKIPQLRMGKKERLAEEALLLSVLRVQSKSYFCDDMIEFVERTVNKYNSTADKESTIYLEKDENDNIYLTKGLADTYPCIVAHLDTVHSLIPKTHYKVYNDKDRMFAVNLKTCERAGVGGDDKVGIYVAISSILNPKREALKVALFVDEEVGCRGSRNCNMDFFDNVSFVLQADRQGYHDFVNNIMGKNLYSEDFAEAIAPILKRYGKKEVSGMMTDVEALSDNGIGVCVANCSCGYYNPHTDKEYVVVSEAILTYRLFNDIIDNTFEDGRRWLYKSERKKYSYNDDFDDSWYLGKRSIYGNSYNYYNQSNRSYGNVSSNTIEKPYEVCRFCGGVATYYPVSKMYYCDHCQLYNE